MNYHVFFSLNSGQICRLSLFILFAMSQILVHATWCIGWNLERKSLQSDHIFALHVNDEHPLGQIVGKGAFFLASIWYFLIFDGHFLFPREILTGCCRWRCLTFSGCSDGLSICHGQGHRSHRTVMGRGCQNWSKMARHFPYYLTTAVRLQNKTKRIVCETYILCLRHLPTYYRGFQNSHHCGTAYWNVLFQ